jgi:hypothetical protein
VNEETKQWLEIGAFLIASGGFLFGVIQYFRQERLKVEDRRIAAARPFLELQLQLYKEATGAAAKLCTTDDIEQARAISTLLELYWGHLSMVENAEVEAAMVSLKSGIDRRLAQEELQVLSLQLAHACRSSLGKSWNTHAWERH